MTVNLAFDANALPEGPMPHPTKSYPDPAAAWAPPAWRPFDRWDMPPGPRNHIVKAGGHRVLESQLAAADRSTYSSSCRNEFYADKDTIGGLHEGDPVAFGFGIWLPVDFQTDADFHLVAQLHVPSDYPQGYASPMVALSVTGGQYTLRNNATGNVIGTFPYQRGEWQYVVVETTISRSPVPVKTWAAAQLPDVALPPTFSKPNPTLPPTLAVKPSYLKFGQYRRPGTTTTLHIVRYDAIVVGTSAAQVVERMLLLCRPEAIPNPPPPPRPSVASLITQSIQEHQQNAWYYRKFQDHNPILAPLVLAYLDGGDRPTDTQLGDNHYAKALVLAEDARRQATQP